MATPPHLRAPRAPRDWDQRFIALARHIASWSKDPSTQVGAVAVRERRILATGYNGFPSGVSDDHERLSDRERRLAMTVHAEQNLVAYAARHGVCLAGATVYVWPLTPCSHCAANLIQAGIRQVIIPDVIEPLRWAESFQLSRLMFSEAGIQLLRLPLDGSTPVEQQEGGTLLEILGESLQDS